MILNVLLLSLLAALVVFLIVYWIVWELRGRNGAGQRFTGRVVILIVLASIAGLVGLGAVATRGFHADSFECVVTEEGNQRVGGSGPGIGTAYPHTSDSGCRPCDYLQEVRWRLFWPAEIISRKVTQPCS